MTQYPTLIATRWVYLFALAIGFLQALAFDIPFDSPISWAAPLLSFLSLWAFLRVLCQLSPKRGGLFAYLFALAYFGHGLNWVYISMANYGGAPIVFAVLANISVIAYLALYWLLGGYLIIKLGSAVNQRLLLAAPLIALLEWLRSIFLIGFPWLSVGYAWVDSPFAHLAAFGGVFFLSFLVILIAAFCLLTIALRYRLLLLGSVFALSAGLAFVDFSSNKQSPLQLALIQGNMSVITEYHKQRMDKNLIQYHNLTDKALEQQKKTDLVIWPEAAIPYFYVDAKEFLQKIHHRQTLSHFDLISGVPNYMQGDYYNSVLLQKENGNKVQFYHKQHLLPFGEYLPFRRLFAFFENYVSIPMSDFSRGDVIQPAFNVGENRLSPSICFEIVFGNEIRQNALQADMLLNLSNDAWFGRSKAQRQHLNIARLRAIENQKPLVRATNNGLTVIVAANGQVKQSLPPFQDGVLSAAVSGVDSKTPYARWGDMPWLIGFVLMAGWILFAAFRPR